MKRAMSLAAFAVMLACGSATAQQTSAPLMKATVRW